MNLHDHHRRILDLETALTELVAALAANHAPIVEEAVRSARVKGARAAEELLRGSRVRAAYRRV